MKKSVLFIILMMESFVLLLAQNPTQTTVLRIERAADVVNIDGVLDEATWANAHAAEGFYQTFPVDDRLADEQTIVKLSYDDKFLYVGAICYTSKKGEYLIESLRRDFGFGRNDVFAIYIDPYND
ncbi:MAG: hydrolase, partial [bacterium]|nr:hydrolase [bacterium]